MFVAWQDFLKNPCVGLPDYLRINSKGTSSAVRCSGAAAWSASSRSHCRKSRETMLELDRVPWSAPSQGQTNYKPWETLWNSVKIWTIHNFFTFWSVFKNRLRLCKPRIWKSQKFCASVDSGLMAAAQTFRSITNLSVMFLAISLLLSVDFYVDISWLISLDLWEGRGTTWKPTRFQRQQKTKPADHLPRKNYRNYNKISEKFPFGNWGKLIEILRKPQNQKIKTHLNKSWPKVEETTNRHHQSVRFLPHGHRPSRWSVSFNRLTACVGDPVMGKADSGDENAPIRKGW